MISRAVHLEMSSSFKYRYHTMRIYLPLILKRPLASQFSVVFFSVLREAVVRGEDGTIRGTVKVKGTLSRSSKCMHITGILLQLINLERNVMFYFKSGE